MDNEEKNVVDLLIKRLEMAPSEFFKIRSGTSSEQMHDPECREIPPYMLPQWARVVRQVMFGASDADWKRLNEAFGKALMHLAEAEFYDTVDRMKSDELETNQKAQSAASIQQLMQAQMAQAQTQSQQSALQAGSTHANSLSGLSAGHISGDTAVRAGNGQSFTFDGMLKKIGLI